VFVLKAAALAVASKAVHVNSRQAIATTACVAWYELFIENIVVKFNCRNPHTSVVTTLLFPFFHFESSAVVAVAAYASRSIATRRTLA
jgi:hypothetical protein